MKKYLLLMLPLVFFAIGVQAQTFRVEGIVTDQGNVPLIGATVFVKASATGTVTDIEGKFALTAEPTDELEIAFVGYKTQNISIDGRNYIAVQLSEGELLSDVVVTALGVSKEKKTLGYAVTELNEDDIENSGVSNIVKALQGRSPGVQMQTSSGAPGAGVDVIIRGLNSIDPTRNNQPLYIIDGIEVSNDVDVPVLLPSGVSFGLETGSSTQSSTSSRLVDINPNDIESINVLKGAAATALYGVRASNGAVVITTKKGKAGKNRFEVSFAGGWSDANKVPKVQTEFIDGHRSTSIKRNGFLWDSWGAKVTDKTTSNPHNVYKELYQTGHSNDISASYIGGSDKFNFRLSGNYSANDGITPTSYFDRVNFGFNGNYKATDRLDFTTSFLFGNSKMNAPHEGRKSVQNVLRYTANVADMSHYTEPYTYGGNAFAGIIDHALYLSEHVKNYSNVNRVLTSFGVNYDINDQFSINYNLGVDNYANRGERIVPPETDEGQSAVDNSPYGFMTVNNQQRNSLTSNIRASYNTTLNDRWSFGFTLGQYIFSRRYQNTATVGKQFVIQDYFNLNNTLELEQYNEDRKYRNAALYGELTFGYENFLYLTLTGRNDWTSTLPKDNRSYFFPSASLSWVVSDMVEMSGVNFMKIRMSLAQIGKDAQEYRIGQYFGTNAGFPFGSAAGFTSSNSIGDLELRPEFTNSFEIGGEFRFLKNRLGLDITYYHNKTKDMILSVPISTASGNSRFITNAGRLTNYGVEFMVDGQVVKSDNNGFNWNTSINWSTNKGKVDEISLDSDVNEVIFATNRNVTNKLVEGGKVGDLYGNPFQRTESGELILAADGLPRLDLTQQVLMGNAMPDFIAGWNNDFSWKGLGFTMLWEWKKGGDVISVSQNYSVDNGQTEETLGRYQKVVFDGVKQTGEDANGNPIYETNDIEAEITALNFYRNSSVYRYAPEAKLQDASWIRLRSLSVYYDLPLQHMNATFIQGARISFTGTNLFVNTPFHGFDPELNFYGAGSNIYGFTGLRTPAVKEFRIKIDLTF